MKKINNELEELTSKILLDNDMYKIPVDLYSIVRTNDIDIYEGNMDKRISGAIRLNKKNKPAKFEILLNKNDAETRKRFTLAHELGHFFLHRPILEDETIHIDTMYRKPTETEIEVDYFAGALLMNRVLLEKLRNTDKTISELAEIFKVSESAMTVRLSILGLL